MCLEEGARRLDATAASCLRCRSARVCRQVRAPPKPPGAPGRRPRRGSTKYYMGVDFVDNQNGWLVGEEQTSCGPTDGGASWKQQHLSPGAYGLSKVQMWSATRGWAVGNGGALSPRPTGRTGRHECRAAGILPGPHGRPLLRQRQRRAGPWVAVPTSSTPRRRGPTEAGLRRPTPACRRRGQHLVQRRRLRRLHARLGGRRGLSRRQILGECIRHVQRWGELDLPVSRRVRSWRAS